jgi:hypothetical protein
MGYRLIRFSLGMGPLPATSGSASNTAQAAARDGLSGSEESGFRVAHWGDGESGGTEDRLWLKPMALLSRAVERVSEIAVGLLRYPNPHVRPLRPILLHPEVCRSVRHGGRIQPEPAVQRRPDASLLLARNAVWGNRELVSLHWGLIPHWSKEPKTSYSSGDQNHFRSTDREAVGRAGPGQGGRYR